MKRLLVFTASMAALVVAYTLLATAAVPWVPSNTWLAGGDLSEVRAGASATLDAGPTPGGITSGPRRPSRRPPKRPCR